MSDSFSVEAVIRRRLLVNFRVSPDILAKTLPPPFEPRLVHGWGMAGVLPIGLGNFSTGGVPAALRPTTGKPAHPLPGLGDAHTGRRRGASHRHRATTSP